MKRLVRLSIQKSKLLKTGFKRFLFKEVDRNQRLIMILGHRGAGKTTLLLQWMSQQKNNAIYLSLDDIYFESNRLIRLVDSLYLEGYKSLYLDEVHRYSYWSVDLKGIYDNYPDVNVVATGSSVLEVYKGQADLSRRAALYHLPGLSFREFIEFEHKISFKPISLSQLVEDHVDIYETYQERIDIDLVFKEYLQYGYFPFFKEGLKMYPQWLQETTRLVMELDIAAFEELNHSTVHAMRKVLYTISQSVPFIPNISKLSDKLGIPRNTILKMLDLLDRAKILSLLRSDNMGVSYLQKPEKIYLQNTNLIYALSEDKPNIGNVRETFFLSQGSGY